MLTFEVKWSAFRYGIDVGYVDFEKRIKPVITVKFIINTIKNFVGFQIVKKFTILGFEMY